MEIKPLPKPKNAAIRKINIDEFNTCYYEAGNRLANYYVNQDGGTKVILAAFMGNEPIGYLICKYMPIGGIMLQYIFVMEPYRRQGIAGRLFVAIEDLGRGEKQNRLTISLQEKTVGLEYLHNYLIKNNYSIAKKTYIFRYELAEFENWYAYMETDGKKLIERLEKKGYRTVSLADIDEKTAQDIGVSEKFVKQMSFVSFDYENKPVAHCMGVSPDKISIICDQLFVAADFRKTGVMLLPFAMSMRRLKESGEYKRVVWAIDEENVLAVAFMKRLLGEAMRNQKIQYTFEKNIRRKDN